jgi:uncharacterized protein YjbJ (UPF0337 family)
MDVDRVKGKLKDIRGRVKRQVGEWVGERKTQSGGSPEQAKGKIQNAWGKLKDAGRQMLDRDQGPQELEHKRNDPAA